MWRGPPIDIEQAKTDVLDYISISGARKTDQIILEFKGRYSPETVARALRLLKEKGYIFRENNRKPWVFKGRQPPTSSPDSL